MAYDGEANIAFDCPGHQGGQFYRKSPAGQLFFKHFGESIFRNDSMQCRRRPRRSAHPRGSGSGGAALCGQGVWGRQDIFCA